MRDPYIVLGVRVNASPDEIKAAWRAAAKLVHPDQNPDDPHAAARFTEIGRAYELLKDPEKRQNYDRARQAANQRRKDQTFMERRAQERARAEEEARAKAQAAQDEKEAALARESAEDMVSRIFGTRPNPEEAASQSDRQAEDRQGEAYRQAAGGSQGWTSRPRASASGWDGPNTGAGGPEANAYAPGAQDEDGGAFRGGSARDLIGYLLRRLTRAAPAPDKAPDLAIDVAVDLEDLIERRNQSVTLADGRQISVDLPQGVLEGDQIRLEGQGHRLAGMKRGDVVATFRFKPHRWFRAEGHNLVTFHPVDIENAVLGCETIVETLTGQERITIPEWSGSDHVVIVEGHGLPRPDGSRGDLLVEVRVMLWDLPDQKVIDLMRSLREGLFL